ncbi:MAG: hypothetical protein P1P86_09435 [Bacteroidales bacterium]|nr:hypothetical protein [Bacteroidales bacterium]
MGKARLELSGNQNKEFQSTLCDLSILSNLALFHSRRIPAAVSYCIFERTGDPHALDDAIAYESKAIEAWENIVAATADIYASDIKMGVQEYLFMDIHHHLTGHWRDELGYLENGLEKLKSQRSTLGMEKTARTAPLYQAAPEHDPRALFQIQHQAVRTAPLNENITIRATVTAPSGIRWVRLRYRSVNQHLDYKTLDMTPEAGSDSYEATVPAGEMDEKYDFMYFLEVMNTNGYGRMYPDFNVETPYIIVKLER